MRFSKVPLKVKSESEVARLCPTLCNSMLLYPSMGFSRQEGSAGVGRPSQSVWTLVKCGPRGVSRGQTNSSNSELACLCGFKPVLMLFEDSFLSVNIYNSVKTPGQLVMHFEVC